ncbi:MAG: aminotransferase class V-fold PLP-dependent enzyme [Capnocytophaga sp.]|nr:aminotransferase class V-fold PLP-dependent enzyme [Capnocytophaga sp.]
MKYSFKNDYTEGCHPKILESLLVNNLKPENGYGLDSFSQQAEQLILDKIKNPQSKVYFVSGGTQANLIVISAILRPHESVISAVTGHILNNETAAIEATGHKINSMETTDGKLKPTDIQYVLDSHTNIPHQVKPKMVYISNATEVGTLYSKQELQELSDFCRQKSLYLFMDGARLSHALAAETNDISEEDLAKLTDIFYWGGTKNGALLGEAIVINNLNLQEEFGFHIKQKGALLAKGRLLGIQFVELKENDIYVLATPMYNWSIPSGLKAYIDQIMRINETWKFRSGTPDGDYVGLLTHKKMFLLSSRGDTGYGKHEKNAHMNFQTTYLSFIFRMMGVTDITVISLDNEEFGGDLFANSQKQAFKQVVEVVADI